MECKKSAGLVLIITLVMAGCYPYDPMNGDESDVVITLYDKKFDFQTLNTFALPDEVVKITGNLEEGEDPEFIQEEYAVVILNGIRENMIDAGWTEVDAASSPDVILLPSALQSTTTYWYYEDWYWDYWYPYYWWGWYYPYPVYDGEISTGSVFIQMTYPDGQTPADNIPVIWSSILNGIMDGEADDFEERVNTGLDQAFKQSSYLELN